MLMLTESAQPRSPRNFKRRNARVLKLAEFKRFERNTRKRNINNTTQDLLLSELVIP